MAAVALQSAQSLQSLISHIAAMPFPDFAHDVSHTSVLHLHLSSGQKPPWQFASPGEGGLKA